MNVFEIIQLLAMLPILAIIGDPLRHYVFSRSDLFRDLNLLQTLLLDFYVGGSILYLIALIPTGVFGALIPFILPITFILFLYIRKELLARIIRSKFSFSIIGRQGLYTFILLASIFLTVFLIRVYVQSNFVFGGVADQPFHSLVVRKIMDEGSIAYTLEPYVLRYSLPDAPLQYQQGLHVILAYVASIFNWTAPNAVRLGDMLFQALGVLGGYYLGKKALNSDLFGLTFAFVFAFISRWPKTMAWGSNAFTLGFPLFLITIATLTYVWKNGASKNDILPLGLLVGFLGAIHPVYLFVVALAMLIMLAKIRVHHLFLVGLIVFIFIAPVVITRTQDPYIATPTSMGLDPLIETLNRAITGDWISPFPFMRYLVLFLLPAGVLWIYIRRKDEQIKSFINVTTVIIISGLILTLALLGISELPLPGLPQYQLHMGVVYNSLLLFSGILIGDILVHLLNLLKENKPILKTGLNRKFLVTIAIFFILVPFVFHGGINETNYVIGQVKYYDAMTKDDLTLIQWMQENIPDNSTVLVQRFDGGVYLPSLAGYRTLFVPIATLSGTNPDYNEIVNSIASGKLTPEIYEKIQEYGFEYLWIGGNISPHGADLNWSRWKPEAIQGNPNFKLIKSIGASYLFKINISDPYSHTIFKEDFQTNSLKFWQIATRGDGEGEANIISYNGTYALQVKTRMSIISTSFATYLYRSISVPDPNVTLDFKVSFEGSYRSIYIYDTEWKNRIEIPIRNPGEFSIDIGKLWATSYDVSLPEKIIIQLVNRGDSGMENTVTFDYIGIRT
jgi:hypothetical protein